MRCINLTGVLQIMFTRLRTCHTCCPVSSMYNAWQFGGINHCPLDTPLVWGCRWLSPLMNACTAAIPILYLSKLGLLDLIPHFLGDWCSRCTAVARRLTQDSGKPWCHFDLRVRSVRMPSFQPENFPFDMLRGDTIRNI